MILGVESSCDDTGLAVWESGQFIYEQTSSQIDLHALYGGVVPQLAAREHLRNFPILLKDLQKRIDPQKIRQIAVTCGPGLPGSLALGIAFAWSLRLALGCELVGVHHLRGHILSPFIEYPNCGEQKNLFPHLSLLVSGGNTILSSVDETLNIHVLAATIDDAAGEAIDKGAKLLGLRYPGGPEIEQYAQQGDSRKYIFPQAFPQNGEWKFSFSGIKTSLRYRLEALTETELKEQFHDICAGYQRAIIDILVRKLRQALQHDHFGSIGLSGGVANNRLLRERVQELGEAMQLPVFLPKPKYTGDNASMIAFAAAIDPAHTTDTIDFKPNWPL